MILGIRVRHVLPTLLACLLCNALPAATYLPMPDADLMARSPIIVRAQVMSQTVRPEDSDGSSRLFTIVTLQRLELIKGSVAEFFEVRLAGGRLGTTVWKIPGTPVFTAGQEVILFLGPTVGHSGQYRLSEFGLSKFDLVADAAGRRFAVRPVFGLEEDMVVSARAAAPDGPGAQGPPRLARDADSFLAALRSFGRGEKSADVVMAEPSPGLGPEWVNVSGREPGDPGGCGDVPCLVRWFWDSGASPNAVLTTTGTQSNLVNDEPNCGTDSVCDVKNAAAQWHGVAQSDVRYSGPTAGGNIPVDLDSTLSFDGGMAWDSALGCPPTGVIGLGGPSGNSVLTNFKGDPDYVVASGGEVAMRKVTCTAPGYSARVFRSAILHEVGHTLGLGHPDEEQSLHSTTTSTDWSNAVMHSVIPPSAPGTPQTDDIQAVQYYYGTAAANQPPVAGFSFSPASPPAGSPVNFTDTSTNGPVAYTWDFGDGTAYGTVADPTHAFANPGTYTVTLYAGNSNGTGTVSKTVVVIQSGGPSTCTASGTTLCLSSGRFQVTATFQKPNDIQRVANAVTLTPNTGYFWFFDSTNVEVVTKVLPFCANPFNSIWVFAAGLTNVKVDLTYVDTKNGATVVKSNPQGTEFAPVQDTKAFKTCP